MKYTINLTDEEKRLLESFMTTTTNELNLFKTAKFEPTKNDNGVIFKIGDEVYFYDAPNTNYYVCKIIKEDETNIMIMTSNGPITAAKTDLRKTGKNIFKPDKKSTPS